MTYNACSIRIALIQTAVSWEFARTLSALSLFRLDTHVFMTTTANQAATAGKMFAYSPYQMVINVMIHSSAIQAVVITLDATINAKTVKSADITPRVNLKIVMKKESFAFLHHLSLYQRRLHHSNKNPTPLYLGTGSS